MFFYFQNKNLLKFDFSVPFQSGKFETFKKEVLKIVVEEFDALLFTNKVSNEDAGVKSDEIEGGIVSSDGNGIRTAVFKILEGWLPVKLDSAQLAEIIGGEMGIVEVKVEELTVSNVLTDETFVDEVIDELSLFTTLSIERFKMEIDCDILDSEFKNAVCAMISLDSLDECANV